MNNKIVCLLLICLSLNAGMCFAETEAFSAKDTYKLSDDTICPGGGQQYMECMSRCNSSCNSKSSVVNKNTLRSPQDDCRIDCEYNKRGFSKIR